MFRWHIGRKLFLRTCAELGVNQWNAKLMCGRSVSKDIETYINGVQLKNDFLKVSNVLRLKPKETSNQKRFKKDLDYLKMSHQELVQEIEKTKKQLRKALHLLEIKGMTEEQIEDLVIAKMSATLPSEIRRMIDSLEDRKKLGEVTKVLEIIAKDLKKRMQRRKKKDEKSLKALKDFLGE